MRGRVPWCWRAAEAAKTDINVQADKTFVRRPAHLGVAPGRPAATCWRPVSADTDVKPSPRASGSAQPAIEREMEARRFARWRARPISICYYVLATVGRTARTQDSSCRRRRCGLPPFAPSTNALSIYGRHAADRSDIRGPTRLSSGVRPAAARHRRPDAQRRGARARRARPDQASPGGKPWDCDKSMDVQRGRGLPAHRRDPGGADETIQGRKPHDGSRRRD